MLDFCGKILFYFQLLAGRLPCYLLTGKKYAETGRRLAMTALDQRPIFSGRVKERGRAGTAPVRAYDPMFQAMVESMRARREVPVERDGIRQSPGGRSWKSAPAPWSAAPALPSPHGARRPILAARIAPRRTAPEIRACNKSDDRTQHNTDHAWEEATARNRGKYRDNICIRRLARTAPAHSTFRQSTALRKTGRLGQLFRYPMQALSDFCLS